MNALFRSLGICAGIGTLSVCAWAQRYVISARPGAVNYVEGAAFLDGKPIAQKQLGQSFLQPNDVVSTGLGKAEILLIPGTFLRIGANSAARMVALSLTDIQVRVMRGEAILEVDELTKENSIRILPGPGTVAPDASVLIQSPGLYRFTANGQPSVAVIKGKAEVSYAGRQERLHGHHEVVLAATIEKRKFDKKQVDDLYAWSNARSEYESAASYETAQNAWQNRGLYGGGIAGGFATPGWAWNPMFASWAWLPGADMSFFSPFGYGFFAPAVVAYAPICYANTNGRRWTGPWHGGHRSWVPIAVNPAHPPATGTLPRSIAEQQAASDAARHVFASGFRTSSGNYVPFGARWVNARSGSPRFRTPTGANRAWRARSNGGSWTSNNRGAAHWSHPNARSGGGYSGGGYHGGGGGFRGGGFGGAHTSGGMSEMSHSSMGSSMGGGHSSSVGGRAGK